jgi:hypothetical protein
VAEQFLERRQHMTCAAAAADCDGAQMLPTEEGERPPPTSLCCSTSGWKRQGRLAE